MVENRSHTGEQGSELKSESRNSMPSIGDPKIVSFESLAEGHRFIVIEFKGQQYRLSLTKSGRLVLTK